MSLGLLTLLIVLVFAAWFWSDSLAAREHVTRVCDRACAKLGMQFLDETVALRRLRLARGAAGHLVVKRFYSFDFSTAGHDRCHAHAVMLGKQLDLIELQHPEGNLIFCGGKRGVLGATLPSQHDLKHPRDKLH